MRVVRRQRAVAGVRLCEGMESIRGTVTDGFMKGTGLVLVFSFGNGDSGVRKCFGRDGCFVASWAVGGLGERRVVSSHPSIPNSQLMKS